MQKKLWWTALMTPLVITPVAIVASCGSGTTSNSGSNDKPNNDANGGSGNTTIFSVKTNVNLIGLFQSESNPEQYKDSNKLAQLISIYKNQIFNNPPDNLYPSQFRLGEINVNVPDGSVSFKIKVRDGNNPDIDLIPRTDVTLRGFSKTTSEPIIITNDRSEISWMDVHYTQRNPFLYIVIREKLIRLIVDNKDTIFQKVPSDLEEEQIEIVGNVELGLGTPDDFGERSDVLAVQIKIRENSNPSSAVLLEPTKILLEGFQRKPIKDKFRFEMTNEQRDLTQYAKDKTKLINLILEKQEEIFGINKDFYNFSENQIAVGITNLNIADGDLEIEISVDFSDILLSSISDIQDIWLKNKTLKLEGFHFFRKGSEISFVNVDIYPYISLILTEEQRDTAQYLNDKAKLIKLIVDQKDRIFSTNYYQITENQIEIGNIHGLIEPAHPNFGIEPYGLLSFNITVKAGTDPNAYILFSGLMNLGKFNMPDNDLTH